MNNFPEVSDSLVVLIDVQEKFVPAIPTVQNILPRQKLILKAASELKLSTIITEQYPKGLGNTVPELKELFQPEWPVFEKSSFSCFGSTEFRKELTKSPKKYMAVMGIETHVCLLQTVVDALNKGYKPIVLADTVASRNEYDRQIALDFMRQQGAMIITAEAFLFMLMKDSGHPAFRAVSKLLK